MQEQPQEYRISALHNHASKNGGQFPPAYTVDSNGKPLHSWRTLILAHLDQRALYERIDFSKPWDDPANSEALKTAIDVYSCPASENPDNLTTSKEVLRALITADGNDVLDFSAF